MATLIWVLVLAIPLAALALKVFPKRISEVRFRDTSPEHAWVQIAQYAEGTFEQKFGYPSGYFAMHEKKSVSPDRVHLDEAQPSGTLTDGCAIGAAGIGMSGFDEGLGAGCITAFLGLMIAAPFILISTADRVFRYLFRSRVDARLRKDGDDTLADFTFYGIGGYVLHKRYASVFAAPQLPVEVFPPDPVAAPAQLQAPAAPVETQAAGPTAAADEAQ